MIEHTSLPLPMLSVPPRTPTQCMSPIPVPCIHPRATRKASPFLSKATNLREKKRNHITLGRNHPCCAPSHSFSERLPGRPSVVIQSRPSWLWFNNVQSARLRPNTLRHLKHPESSDLRSLDIRLIPSRLLSISPTRS
jgi:hypothetical protein